MGNSKLLDHCFAAAVAIVLLGFFAAIAVALIDGEPRQTRVHPIVQIP